MIGYLTAGWGGFLAGWAGWGAVYWPVLLAFGIAAGGAAVGALAGRRWRWVGSVAGAVGVAAGWYAVGHGGLRGVLWPRSTIEFLVMPALVFGVGALLALQVRSRWIAVGVAGFGAWWLAGSPAGRPEFWRVLFGALAMGWALRRPLEARAGFASALSVWGALLVARVGGAGLMALEVLAAGYAGLWAVGRGAAMPNGVLVIGLVFAELFGGRVQRGVVGVVDLACLAVLGVPRCLPWLEQGLRRRVGRFARLGAVVVAAAAAVGVCWVVSRALR